MYYKEIFAQHGYPGCPQSMVEMPQIKMAKTKFSSLSYNEIYHYFVLFMPIHTNINEISHFIIALVDSKG